MSAANIFLLTVMQIVFLVTHWWFIFHPNLKRIEWRNFYMLYVIKNHTLNFLSYIKERCVSWFTFAHTQGCQPVRNFRILYGFYMQNTGVPIWPIKYGNWALSVLSLGVLLSEQSLTVLGSNSVKFGGILCLKPFKYLFNHQNIQSSLFHMW